MKGGGSAMRGKPEEAIEEATKPPTMPPIGAPPVDQQSLDTAVSTADTATVAVVESGPEAERLAGQVTGGEQLTERERRAEERHAEDRRGIIDLGARYGITISEERAEEIRARAWEAADEAARSDGTLAAARDAGYAATEGFDVSVQGVRDAYHTIIGDAAARAARHVLEDELAQEGLSGDTLDQAAREMSRLARVREVHDASVGSRELAEELIAQRQGEYAVQNAQDDLRVLQGLVATVNAAAQEARDNPQNAEATLQRARDAAQQAREVAGTMADDYAGNPDVAQIVAQAQQATAQAEAEVQNAEEDVRAGQIEEVAFTFRLNFDPTALPFILEGLGYIDEVRAAGVEHLDRMGFARYGVDIQGETQITVNVKAMHDAGVLSDEDLRTAEGLARTNQAGLLDFLRQKAGLNFNDYAQATVAGQTFYADSSIELLAILAHAARDLRNPLRATSASTAVSERCSLERESIAEQEARLQNVEGLDAGATATDAGTGTRSRVSDIRASAESSIEAARERLARLSRYSDATTVTGAASVSFTAAAVT